MVVRHTGKARNPTRGAAEPTRAVVDADPEFHSGILPGEVSAGEDWSVTFFGASARLAQRLRAHRLRYSR